MRRDPLPEPERWSERGAGTSAEDVIGASFRSIRSATEPSDVAAQRWARRAMAPVPRRAAARFWATAIVGTVLIGGSAAAGVVWQVAVSHERERARAESEEIQRAARARHAATKRASLAPPAAAAATDLPPAVMPAGAPALQPQPPPEPPPPPPELPPAARRALKVARAATPAPSARRDPALQPPPLPAAEGEDEAQLLARAFRRLRKEGDAPAALAALDERERRFGAGTLGTEAALARAEALLLLRRTGDALPILLGIRDARAGLTPDVRATRAELLAQSRRCDEATADFDELLAPGAPAATRERALYARASCRLQGAQPTRAIPDLETYLAEFPSGRSAPIVRAALERLRRRL